MTDQPKQRHGCLTAYLILMIIANSLTSLVYLVGGQSLRQQFPQMPTWAIPVLAALGLVNLTCAIALWRWKKWGFFGFIGSSLAAFVINLMVGISIYHALIGVIGFVILFGVLHIGKEKNGWNQLE